MRRGASSISTILLTLMSTQVKIIPEARKSRDLRAPGRGLGEQALKIGIGRRAGAFEARLGITDWRVPDGLDCDYLKAAAAANLNGLVLIEAVSADLQAMLAGSQLYGARCLAFGHAVDRQAEAWRLRDHAHAFQPIGKQRRYFLILRDLDCFLNGLVIFG